MSIINIYQIKPLKKRILISVLFVFFIASRFISQNNLLMETALLIFAFKDISFNKIVAFSTVVKTILLSLLLIAFFTGIAEDHSVITNTTIRYSLGFSNPNGFSTQLLSIILQIFYLLKGRNSIKKIIVSVIGVLLITLLSKSRTHIICIILLNLLTLLDAVKDRLKIKSFLYRFAQIAFPLCLTISLALPYFYIHNPDSMSKLNELTSKRISSTAAMINQNEITFFGQNVNRISKYNGSTKVFDNGYMYQLLYFGLITTIIFTYANIENTKRFFKEEKVDYIYTTIYNISGLAEKFFLQVTTNIFLLDISSIIYKEENESI